MGRQWIHHHSPRSLCMLAHFHHFSIDKLKIRQSNIQLYRQHQFQLLIMKTIKLDCMVFIFFKQDWSFLRDTGMIFGFFFGQVSIDLWKFVFLMCCAYRHLSGFYLCSKSINCIRCIKCFCVSLCFVSTDIEVFWCLLSCEYFGVYCPLSISVSVSTDQGAVSEDGALAGPQGLLLLLCPQTLRLGTGQPLLHIYCITGKNSCLCQDC